MQLIAEHPLHLKSCWDTYPGISHEAVQDVQQPFSTWKFRSDGESKRIIDYIWYVMAAPAFVKYCDTEVRLWQMS